MSRKKATFQPEDPFAAALRRLVLEKVIATYRGGKPVGLDEIAQVLERSKAAIREDIQFLFSWDERGVPTGTRFKATQPYEHATPCGTLTPPFEDRLDPDAPPPTLSFYAGRLPEPKFYCLSVENAQVECVREAFDEAWIATGQSGSLSPQEVLNRVPAGMYRLKGLRRAIESLLAEGYIQRFSTGYLTRCAV